ncbi:SDR family oxidoreductase [Streptomyces sp. NRRL S-237]|uniref:SDR family oxidoreductase n=1 Tax=Streptomyces sp. NRRL S-237 TaxID=1463895 RepID=UPI00131CCBEB
MGRTGYLWSELPLKVRCAGHRGDHTDRWRRRLRGGAGTLLGSAVSGAVISAGRSLASELAPVRVNVVVPGLVRTPLWSSLAEDEQKALFAWAGSKTLLGRVAEPEDVAKAYLHLIDQDYVTGTVSLVDGGSVLS